ncbi:unnamed protein product [Mytilus coruscus]|uniref:Uncharacterized protein n=1 Tax=Mytilus coruscus TaxID=42192 RepID=A0A6J8CU49_MYTCO|nr:unnamed protein product [Mytilus coruscus]
MGNLKMVHKVLCELGGVTPQAIIVGSIYNKAKRVVHLVRKLKNYRNNDRLQKYLQADFVFPKRVLKRKIDDNDEEMREDCKKLRNTIKVHETSNMKLREKLRAINVSRLNQKIKRQTSTILRQHNTIALLKQRVNDLLDRKKHHEKATQCNSSKSIIKNLEDELDILKSECRNDDNNNVKDDLIQTRLENKGKPFNDKIRQIYYNFRSRGIGLQHCAPLIKCVFNLLNMEIGDLPSKTTASNLTAELGLIAKQHIGEEIDNAENITMHLDATTKLGRHYYGVQITNENHQTFTTGLKDGKATTYVECTKKMLQEVTQFSETLDPPNIFGKVKNFMTDRSATENKVNKILATDISASSPTNTVQSFKCAVHPLLQFSEHEKRESATHCLIRFLSKLFFKDGSGDPLFTKIYLKKHHGIFDVPILNFRGNRFNTFFHNARGTFYLAQYLVTYFKTSKSTLNYTQNFILAALQNNEILCICRALGILCQTITEPYWTIAGNNEILAINIGPTYNRIIELLDICEKNPNFFWKMKYTFYQDHSYL